ncbi:hypothetical protein HF086_011380 [Spodoptera exigua]|uniref:Nuclear condensin complex subunit 3 C-terminal domain-containing protein n=1 Tax=Spodoptera exigua TaxID=7107 RepID=A0A922M9E4_SPOEX|nr:hypothetical protein HF086_011380 [Spodoptera exigua]
MPPTDAEVPQPVAAAKPNPRNNPTMFKIFQNVQYNVVQHKKYVKEMIKLYKKLDEDSFRESFRNALQYLFTFGDTSANVDRVVQFVASFCTSLDDEEEFLLFIFNIIFDCQCVSGQSVRYRASQLLAAVLSALGDDASLDDDLCDKLLASQMQRLQDTRGAVRCRAALALQRLQNPMEPDDEVTRAYRFHMSCDPSSSVRRAIVMSIAKCSRNVPFVLERLCDVDEAVRRAAFLYIAAINVTQLRVRQRVLTLKVGLTERSVRVRRVVEEILIPGWLSTFQGNIVDLLKAIRLDNAHDAKDSQYVAGKLLESLFKRLPISELLEWLPTDRSLRLIPAEKLNKETAWYWRHLSEHLQKIDDDETLESILPDLVVLTGYIRAIVESPCPSETDDPVAFSTRQYVLHELATMLRVYDATDPTGRGELQTLITDVLTGDYGPLNADVIRAFVNALELVLPDIAARMEVVNGIIGALRDPPEPEQPCLPPPIVDCTEAKLQRARLRVSLNVAIEAQEEAVREQNYALAAECKAKVEDIQKKLDELSIQPPAPAPAPPVTTIKEKLSDTATLTKCLTILNSALDTPQVKSITPMMQMIFNELEVDIFQNPEIVETALETVALYGMLDKEFAKENKAFFFANLIDTSNERTVSTVLRCIVDLLCVHGARVFEDDSQEDTTVNTTKKRSTYHSVIDDDGSISESAISMSPAHSTVIELLLKIMDSTCSAYRLIIVEGLCRLLHLGHLESPAILSRLLLLWFNPATGMLNLTLFPVFQSLFSFYLIIIFQIKSTLWKATLPTLRALANAPSSSPLAEIDQEAVVRFIVSLTRVNHELADSQGGMATVLCQYIVRRPSAPEKLPDKQSCRNLTRYLAQPIARSTHVVINETVEEEVEIDETSPNDAISRISEETDTVPADTRDKSTDSSSDESPVKRAKITKKAHKQRRPETTDCTIKKVLLPGTKKKLSLNRPASSDSSKGTKEKAGKGKKDAKEAKETSDQDNKGVKRSRSQRSLVDVERAKAKAEEKTKAGEKSKAEEPIKTEQKTKGTKNKRKQSPKEPVSSQESSSPVSDLDVSNITYVGLDRRLGLDAAVRVLRGPCTMTPMIPCIPSYTRRNLSESEPETKKKGKNKRNPKKKSQ